MKTIHHCEMENFDEKNHSRSNELAQIDGIVPIWKAIWFPSISKHPDLRSFIRSQMACKWIKKQSKYFLISCYYATKWMKNSFFYAEILNTDRTLNTLKIPKKSKIWNMPKIAQNDPKWPKLAPNTFYLCILRLKMS